MKRFLVTKLAGTVNTSAGSPVVNLASGDKFSSDLAGKQIVIAGTGYPISAVNSTTQLTLTAPQAAGATGAVYSIAMY